MHYTYYIESWHDPPQRIKNQKKEHEMTEETKELTELAAAVGVYQEETRARKIAEWVYDASTVFAGIATFYLVLMMVAMWS
ncbi:hypothetical protein BXA20_01535 [Corynebacterium diphtheriae]|nr:hypothetical protein BGK43_03805 [Corynebacterium diphtheriae]ONF69325.1 hypothetical protein BXA20_01535 [Corynebacterium diphtheriae]